MKHKDKIKLARKLSKKGLFSTQAWQSRKEAIAKRVENKIAKIKLAIKLKRGKLKEK
jgi:hypothetical protein